MHKQQGWPQAWEYSQAKLIQTLVRASQGVDWSWSQCIKSHHAQTSSGKGLPSHFWNRNIVRSILPGLWRKRTGLLLNGPKIRSKDLFSYKSKFCKLSWAVSSNQNKTFFFRCFTLHVMNLEYMKVSLFEMLPKNELFHDILIFWDAPVCMHVCMHVCMCVYIHKINK